MLYRKPRVLPAGDAAILVELADEISAEASARVYALAAALDAAGWPGLGEAVPAYAALLVAYDPRRWAYAGLAARLVSLAGDAATSVAPAGPVVDIPVHYGGEDGPDLADLAARRGLTPAQVVALHSGTIYTVYMLGFTPGFAYLGTVPEGIATPRLATPRTRVPAGSVGIAGRQTGIYPQSTPGGWRLIGRTNAVLFDPRREPPSLLGPHDQVRFVPVNDLPPLPPPRLVERKQSRRAKGEIESAASGGENQLAILRGMGEVHALPPGAERPLLQVITPGWLTIVQDLGRPGYQRFGVPVSGAVDGEALAAANALVGNPAGAAALEITLGGLTLHVLADTRAAITGADLDAVLQRGNFGPWEAPLWTDLYLRRDTVLEFRAARRGCRAYLALPGGVAVPTAMGSAATYLAGGFGGLEGRALRGGDVIAAGPDLAGAATACLGGVAVAVEDRPAYSAEPVVRIIPGPHDDYFTPEALAVLTSGVYHVSPASDRMGLRLTGPRLARRDSRELISCGTVLGGLQVPPDGQPIVLLADRQTVGGYPIIATVVCADIPLLAQCVPGQARVRFVPVTVEAAQAAGREYYAAMTPRDLTSEVLGF